LCLVDGAGGDVHEAIIARLGSAGGEELRWVSYL
jgi:hypothetical protein